MHGADRGVLMIGLVPGRRCTPSGFEQRLATSERKRQPCHRPRRDEPVLAPVDVWVLEPHHQLLDQHADKWARLRTGPLALFGRRPSAHPLVLLNDRVYSHSLSQIGSGADESG
jgi:hypothetical protein